MIESRRNPLIVFTTGGGNGASTGRIPFEAIAKALDGDKEATFEITSGFKVRVLPDHKTVFLVIPEGLSAADRMTLAHPPSNLIKRWLDPVKLSWLRRVNEIWRELRSNINDHVKGEVFIHPFFEKTTITWLSNVFEEYMLFYLNFKQEVRHFYTEAAGLPSAERIERAKQSLLQKPRYHPQCRTPWPHSSKCFRT
ncbi:MAG: hypothetical protein COV46_00175 [Deltaproteobacteria bacterium CG11_big_fil_rev_8_21_14_0_20_49_13]|nr:MAG: hypothetical protein COV46_00175 [Deltaproteobacteria bacterium CG11_big_fil_rev_8_21_14_0_20_49_13]